MSWPSWTITEYEGKVAVELPWQVDWEKPAEFKMLRVCDCPFERWERFKGEEVRFHGNEGWTFDSYGRPLRMNVTGWEVVTLEREVKKPRRRKGYYDWVWQHGKWNKVPDTTGEG